MDNIISVTNLTKAYGDVKAVNDISFDVAKGSLFAFLGVNGAGKSTTINILCSILQKNTGTINIDGYDLDTDREKIKQSIGIVFQGSVLDGNLSVKSNLYSRASLYGFSKEKIKERVNYVTKVFELDDILKRSYNKLSGGQRRRVDIARALLNEPKVLFLDEPTTGLDPSTRIMVWNIIQKLKDDENLTIFLTTHYMEEAAKADKIVIIDKGVIVAEGSPDYLKDKYTSDQIRIISPFTSEEFEKIFADEDRIYTYRNGCYYVTTENCMDAIEFLNKHKDIITDFEILKGNMDDVFLNVVGHDLVASEGK